MILKTKHIHTAYTRVRCESNQLLIMSNGSYLWDKYDHYWWRHYSAEENTTYEWKRHEYYDHYTWGRMATGNTYKDK